MSGIIIIIVILVIIIIIIFPHCPTLPCIESLVGLYSEPTWLQNKTSSCTVRAVFQKAISVLRFSPYCGPMNRQVISACQGSRTEQGWGKLERETPCTRDLSLKAWSNCFQTDGLLQRACKGLLEFLLIQLFQLTLQMVFPTSVVGAKLKQTFLKIKPTSTSWTNFKDRQQVNNATKNSVCASVWRKVAQQREVPWFSLTVLQEYLRSCLTPETLVHLCGN